MAIAIDMTFAHIRTMPLAEGRLWRFADSTADDSEGRVVPWRYRRHPKHDSDFSHYLLGTQIDESRTAKQS